jgi:hypothetical protein
MMTKAMDLQATTPEHPSPATRLAAGRGAIPQRGSASAHRDVANPTFGVEHWPLGLLAAVPAFVCALGFLLCTVDLPRLPRLPLSLVLGILLVLLGLGALAAHQVHYPAWTQPGVALLPTLGLFLPAAAWHGQIVALIDGDPDPVVVVPLAITALLLAAALLVAAAVVATIGRHAPSFSGAALLPLPLLAAWTFALAPPFREFVVIRGYASALALAAGATFIAWITPRQRRGFVPLAAIGVQFLLFLLLQLGWPGFSGALWPVIAFDTSIFVLAVILVGVAPLSAVWMRRLGWPALTGQEPDSAFEPGSSPE